MANEKSVLGEALQLCCGNTGFTREGFCYVPDSDHGNHSVCAVMTDEFLAYSKARGNDLISPNPIYGFPGLKAGDRWCLCASRWYEATAVKLAPPVILSATNSKCLDIIPLDTLIAHAHES